MNGNENTGMFSRIRRRRHLQVIFEEAAPKIRKAMPAALESVAAARKKQAEEVVMVSEEQVKIPQEFTPHQYAIFLLHVAAELEHVLMVQYLYAAYSLGGFDIPVEHRKDAARWREIILGIAKEEMGHLMTMQNLLRCLGGPLNLDREDYPWDSEFYPFPFMLEPLSRESLAKYIVAESPEDWTGPEADEIKAIALAGTGGAELNRVGKLFEEIEKLLVDPKAVKDVHFRGATYPFQATWDEWGRGYAGGARGNTFDGDSVMPNTPDVLLLAVTARTDSLEALRAIATQGEATPTANDSAPSHFARFLRIFREMPKDGIWAHTQQVPTNPIVLPDFAEDDPGWPGTPITHPQSKQWAHLFNIRYRLLLTNLLHTFDYPNNLTDASQLSPRGLLIHATFGEMYNMRAIAEMLVQMPLNETDPGKKAGAPFQMPYTLKLPHDLADRWRLHLDLLEASGLLVNSIVDNTPDNKERAYLQMLEKVDNATIKSIQAILDKF